MEQRKRKKNEKCRGRKSCRFETLSLEEVFVRINETNAFNVEIVRELEFRPWIYFSSPLRSLLHSRVSSNSVQKKARRLFLAFRTSNSLDIVLCSLLALSLTIVAEQRGEKIRKSRVTGRVILPDPNRKIAGQERSTKLADEMSGDSNNRHFYFLFYLQFFHFSRLFTLLHDRDICKKKKRKKKRKGCSLSFR